MLTVPQWLRIVKCLSSCNENAVFTHRPYLLFTIVPIMSWLESSKRSSSCIRFAGSADKKLLELLPSTSWVYFCWHNARLYERRVYYSAYSNRLLSLPCMSKTLTSIVSRTHAQNGSWPSNSNLIALHLAPADGARRSTDIWESPYRTRGNLKFRRLV